MKSSLIYFQIRYPNGITRKIETSSRLTESQAEGVVREQNAMLRGAGSVLTIEAVREADMTVEQGLAAHEQHLADRQFLVNAHMNIIGGKPMAWRIAHGEEEWVDEARLIRRSLGDLIAARRPAAQRGLAAEEMWTPAEVAARFDRSVSYWKPLAAVGGELHTGLTRAKSWLMRPEAVEAHCRLNKITRKAVR